MTFLSRITEVIFLLSRGIAAGFILLLISHSAFAVQRIVSLAPNLTEIVYAAGAGSQLIGVSSFSDYPPEALQLPQLSNYAGVDIERVLALKPSLILALRNENAANQLELLGQAGINIQFFKIETFTDIFNAILWVGKIAGTESIAKEQVAQISNQYQSLLHQNTHKRLLKVLYLISINPLLTLNKSNLVSQMIHNCGGINIYSNLQGAAPEVSWSSVLTTQPDVILVAHDVSKKNDLSQITQQWPQLKAVQEHHVFYVNADWTNRPGPRSIQGMKQICADLALSR